MKTALVFAGQGAQFVGMGKDLAEKHPECKTLFDKADAALGFKLSSLCFNGPIEELTKSSNCQPAIFVVSMACMKAFEIRTGMTDIAGAAGLSLGEWSALHAGGALSFDDTLRVLEARGRFMQEACDEKQGGMVSIIGLPMDKLQEICRQAGVEIANLNSAEQTVLSGEKTKIEQAETLARAAGAKKTIMLKVAGAFHSSLMASAANKLERILENVSVMPPKVPVLSNATGSPHGQPADIRKAMIRQVTGSVRWISCIEWLKNNGVKRYVELGPGKVLSGLIKRIDSESATLNIQDVPSLDMAAGAFKS